MFSLFNPGADQLSDPGPGLLQLLRIVGKVGIHVGAVRRSIDVDRRRVLIPILQNTHGVPGINRAVHKDDILYLGEKSAILGIGRCHCRL